MDEPLVYVMLGLLLFDAAPTTVAVQTKLGFAPPVVNTAEFVKLTTTLLAFNVANPETMCWSVLRVPAES
jgi:hypothetical protein